METVFAILHVVGAVFIVGPLAILPMTGLRAVRAGQANQVATLAKSISITAYLSVLVIVFGFGLMGVADPKYNLSLTTSWIWMSLVAWAIAVVATLVLVVPSLRKAAAGLASGGTVDSSSYPRIAAGSGVTALLLVLAVVLMVWKP
ncbi:hypothetical protein BH09ACT3_BH09ACT3_15000 [soil metagenome]